MYRNTFFLRAPAYCWRRGVCCVLVRRNNVFLVSTLCTYGTQQFTYWPGCYMVILRALVTAAAWIPPCLGVVSLARISPAFI